MNRGPTGGGGIRRGPPEQVRLSKSGTGNCNALHSEPAGVYFRLIEPDP